MLIVILFWEISMQKLPMISADNPYPLGVYRTETGVRVSMISEGDTCGLILYDKDKKQIGRFELSNGYRMGKIRYGRMDFDNNEAIFYQLYSDDKVIFDPYMKAYNGRENFGERVEPEDLFSIIENEDYDWEEDKSPGIPYEDSFIYCMHVRGFTKHSSSAVKGKGTFRGIVEKLSHLEDLGVTAIELLPIYELMDGCKQDDRINYWGYDTGFYYAPKNAYAASGRADIEFKNLVKEFHKRNMEVILQFYFPAEMAQSDILEVLRYWRLEYHVDGFHLKGVNIPLLMIASEPGFSDVKLLHYDFTIYLIHREIIMQ